jgi:hypothetical protein
MRRRQALLQLTNEPDSDVEVRNAWRPVHTRAGCLAWAAFDSHPQPSFFWARLITGHWRSLAKPFEARSRSPIPGDPAARSGSGGFDAPETALHAIRRADSRVFRTSSMSKRIRAGSRNLCFVFSEVVLALRHPVPTRGAYARSSRYAGRGAVGVSSRSVISSCGRTTRCARSSRVVLASRC